MDEKILEALTMHLAEAVADVIKETLQVSTKVYLSNAVKVSKDANPDQVFDLAKVWFAEPEQLTVRGRAAWLMSRAASPFARPSAKDHFGCAGATLRPSLPFSGDGFRAPPARSCPRQRWGLPRRIDRQGRP